MHPQRERCQSPASCLGSTRVSSVRCLAGQAHPRGSGQAGDWDVDAVLGMDVQCFRQVVYLKTDSGLPGQPDLDRARALGATPQISGGPQDGKLVGDTAGGGRPGRLADFAQVGSVTVTLTERPHGLHDCLHPPCEQVVGAGIGQSAGSALASAVLLVIMSPPRQSSSGQS